MHPYQRLAGQMLRRFAPELYPDTVTWTHPQKGPVTCRCSLTALTDLPRTTIEEYRRTPGFDTGTVLLRVHPDDPEPGRGSTARHPRFPGPMTVVAWSPRAHWTQTRMGAVAWTF